jgi:cation transport ATPase
VARRADRRQFIEILLATPVVLWAGKPFFERGWSSIRTGNYNMWTLIMLGVAAAFAYSVVATLAPQASFPSFAARHGWHGAGLFRGGGGHHRAGVRRPGA